MVHVNISKKNFKISIYGHMALYLRNSATYCSKILNHFETFYKNDHSTATFLKSYNNMSETRHLVFNN